MSQGNFRNIQTPAGLVEIGDTIRIDVSNDPVARNYGWPKMIIGKVFGGHIDYLIVDVTVPAPKHLISPPKPLGFAWILSKDNADRVFEVMKTMRRKHRWLVFSTALSSGELMLECSRCNAYATVRPEDRYEWSEAYYASRRACLYRGNGKPKLRDGTKWCYSEAKP